MADHPSAADVARQVADALERHGLAYAIGGAFALGFYAPPRATVDVDVNIFVPPAERLEAALIGGTEPLPRERTATRSRNRPG